MSSLLLTATKEHHFTWLSASTDSDESGFKGSQWITPEDVNVEHFLDVFTSIDASSKNFWDFCTGFMLHLC